MDMTDHHFTPAWNMMRKQVGYPGIVVTTLGAALFGGAIGAFVVITLKAL